MRKNSIIPFIIIIPMNIQLSSNAFCRILCYKITALSRFFYILQSIRYRCSIVKCERNVRNLKTIRIKFKITIKLLFPREICTRFSLRKVIINWFIKQDKNCHKKLTKYMILTSILKKT